MAKAGASVKEEGKVLLSHTEGVVQLVQVSVTRQEE